MNIIVFSRSTTEHFTSGGMETHLKILVEGLAEKGHKIHVITTSHPEHINEDYEEESSKVKYFYLKNTTPGLNPLNNWEKAFNKLGVLNRRIKEEKLNYFIESKRAFNLLNEKYGKVDVVISQSTGAYGVYESLDMPLVSIIHGTIKTEMKNRWYSLRSFKNYIRFFIVDIPKWAYEAAIENKRFFDKCEKIIAVSKQLKSDFSKDYPLLQGKVIVIPNGVDENIFKPGKSEEKYQAFTILYIGRMELEKGVDEIIYAVKALKSKKVEALLIGGGIHLEKFKALANELDIKDKVKFLGQVKNTDLHEYYKKSHVFVLPSKRVEGHPMTVSEAMCSGLPLITTKNGGLKDLFEEGQEGYFIGKEHPLEKRLKELVESPILLKNMSEKSYKKGVESYSKNAMINKYTDCLNNIK